MIAVVAADAALRGALMALEKALTTGHRGGEESQSTRQAAVLDRVAARVWRRLVAERSTPDQVAGGHGASLTRPLPL